MHIEMHAFFSGVDWKALEAGGTEAEFKPVIRPDASNFDPTVTEMPAVVLL